MVRTQAETYLFLGREATWDQTLLAYYSHKNTIPFSIRISGLKLFPLNNESITYQITKLTTQTEITDSGQTLNIEDLGTMYTE